ncbi:MAG TPA: L-seryl-tRNA(Sec) selenium transferase, partial [Actinomycetota bacterium]|nr:L-seryl-tRNA(Sec) selenium transferase [Actinomycetota bacterium]
MKAKRPDRRREVPSLDGLLRTAAGKKAAARMGRSLVKLALQRTLGDVRAAAGRGTDVPEDAAILARALEVAGRDFYGIAEVINATGVVLHTGLGRAPIHARAAEAAAKAARGYSDLEVRRETGARGLRTWRAEDLLVALTGAEAALAVNNNAAALLLSLAALGA